MNAEREEVHPPPRVGPIPMIHWENGRACAGPPRALVHPVPAGAQGAGEIVPSPHAPPPGAAAGA